MVGSIYSHMGLYMRHFNIIGVIIACALISINSEAAESTHPALPQLFFVKGSYLLKFGVLPIGLLDVDGAQTGASFHMKAHAKLMGVAKIISNHKSENQVSGTLTDANVRDFPHAKREFQTHYTSSDGWRTITLVYGENGVLTDEQVEATHEMSYRPKVPADQKNGVSDTMTMVLAAREAIYQANQNGQKNLSMNFYDGKRLSKVNMQIYGVVNRMRKGIKTPVLKVGLFREPVAGYTEKELKRAKEKTMGEALIYFTANDNFVPILAELTTTLGTFSAELR